MKLTFNNRIARFARNLILCASAFGAAAVERADGQDESSANRWTIVFYDSSSPAVDRSGASSSGEARARFEGFVETLRARERETLGDDALNVVVFSPFESRPERRPSLQNAELILDWIRNPDLPSEALKLPALRGDLDAPVDLRLFVDVAVRDSRVVLDGRIGSIGPQDLKQAASESQPRIERVLLVENQRSRGTTRGSAAFAVQLDAFEDDASGDSAEEGDFDEDYYVETESGFPRSFDETTFQATSSEDYFSLLNDALDGYADVGGPYREPDAVITLDELLEYLRSSSPEAPRPTHFGAGVSELYNLATIRERKPPIGLFVRIGKALEKLDPATSKEALSREDWWKRWDDDDFKTANFKSPNHLPVDKPGTVEKIEIKEADNKKYVKITSGQGSDYIWTWLSDVQEVEDRKNNTGKEIK